ncbi:MAG: hypothetical protein P1U46_01010 [Patescibacteria group bacterium]|nr:hypothetical protein [Patescibacteria group bacterium]
MIDKKDKIKSDKLKQLFLEKGINENQISKIMNFIKISDEKTNIEILDYFKSETNTKLLE